MKAFIFDLDGVLTDTETLGVLIAEKTCKELDIELTIEEKLSFIGIPDLEFYQNLFRKRKLDHDALTILTKHTKVYEYHLNNNQLLFPEAKETIAFIKEKGYKIGLVSGSTKKQIQIILKKENLHTYFDCIISYDDVTCGKPHPEGYSICCKQLSINPKNCIVVEDSLNGVKAAKNAGMTVIRINNNLQDVSGADFYIDNLDEIQSRFDEIVWNDN